jgi:hypothetical protein
MNTEHANAALFAALALAQGEIENASKNAANPHFKSKYADLAEVLNTIRPVFAKHGLTLVQFPQFDGARASVETLIGHKDGGYVTSLASCVPAKSDAQGIGSATTYLRRYSAAAAAGIAQEDDDGQAAAHNKKPSPVSAISPDGVDYKALHDDALARHAESVDYIKECLGRDNVVDACREWALIPTDDQRALWLAPSKGGCLTTAQRATLKENVTKHTTTEKAA